MFHMAEGVDSVRVTVLLSRALMANLRVLVSMPDLHATKGRPLLLLQQTSDE
jgi:hypothetical protein